MKKGLFIQSVLLLFMVFGRAQNVSVNSNIGMLYVSPDAILLSIGNFDNRPTGKIVNDGTLYLHSNLNNDGLFSFTGKLKTSYTVFGGRDKKVQQIGGSQSIEVYDVLFDSPSSDNAMDLSNQMRVSGTANFYNGVLKIEDKEGISLIFNRGSEAINMSNDSYAEGMVTKVGNDRFVFPVGQKGYYSYVEISAPKSVFARIQSTYLSENSDSDFPHSSKEALIQKINNQEYWKIETTTNNTEHIVLSLGWNQETIDGTFIENGGAGLGIVRWDKDDNLWLYEGGVVDLINKTVTIPALISKFGVFAIGKIRTDLVLKEDVVVYNAVSPNGDGDNNYLRIENIERFPNNSVSIFNRWGTLVYKTTNYGASGNVFRGVSDGRGTSNKNENLPTGTYYYILEYEVNSQNGSDNIKKAGYLHLENK